MGRFGEEIERRLRGWPTGEGVVERECVGERVENQEERKSEGGERSATDVAKLATGCREADKHPLSPARFLHHFPASGRQHIVVWATT